MSTGIHRAGDREHQLRETCRRLAEPVINLLGVSEAVLAEPGLDSGVRLRLELIAGQAEWLAEMIWVGPWPVDLVCAKDPDDGPAEMVFLVEQAVAAFRSTWSGEVFVTSPPGAVLCGLPPVLIRRLLANVLSNATRAAGPAGEVAVDLRRERGMIALTVEDSGPGFGRIPRGYGIGLAAVARDIRRYGGTLEWGRGARGGARISLWLSATGGRQDGAADASRPM